MKGCNKPLSGRTDKSQAARQVAERANCAAQGNRGRLQDQLEFRSLVEHASEGMFRATVSGQVLYANASLARTLGYASVAEMMSCTDLSVRHFVLAEDRKRFLRQVKKRGFVHGFETQVRRKDGGIIWVSITARLARGAQSRRRWMEGTVEEISKRKQLEVEARAQATNLSMALEAAEMVTWEWDIPRNVVRYSANISTIVRGERVEPYASISALMQRVHPDDREQLARALDRTQKEGASFECEYRVRMLDGIYRWIRGQGKIVLAEGGKPVRVLGVSQEITQRKQGELLLHLQRDLATALSQITELDAALNKILEMALVIHGVDGAGIYLDQTEPPGFRLRAHRGLSAKFTARVSFYPKEWLGMKFLHGQEAWYGLPPELRKHMAPVLAEEGIIGLAVVPLHHENRLIGSLNLASRHCRDIPETSRILVEAMAGQAASAIARIQVEQQRKRLERQILEISDREQARFGQDLHDGLCQQLVSAAFDVNGLAQQLSKRSLPEARTTERLADLLDRAITESRRLAHGLYPVKLDAEGLISALEELAATSRARTGIACLVRSTAGVKVRHHATATHLYRIAQEAVNNAVKHSNARRVIIELTASPRVLRLEVRDDGRGISKTALSSKGMGMHIMNYRARSLGGVLTVANSPDGGTLVSCCVPRARL